MHFNQRSEPNLLIRGILNSSHRSISRANCHEIARSPGTHLCRFTFVASPLSLHLCRFTFVASPLSLHLCRFTFVGNLPLCTSFSSSFSSFSTNQFRADPGEFAAPLSMDRSVAFCAQWRNVRRNPVDLGISLPNLTGYVIGVYDLNPASTIPLAQRVHQRRTLSREQYMRRLCCLPAVKNTA